jgi:hypothetical protein
MEVQFGQNLAQSLVITAAASPPGLLAQVGVESYAGATSFRNGEYGEAAGYAGLVGADLLLAGGASRLINVGRSETQVLRAELDAALDAGLRADLPLGAPMSGLAARSDAAAFRINFAAEIDSVSTFKTYGLGRGAADDYLSTADGQRLLQNLGAADPAADVSKIYARAVDQLSTGYSPSLQQTTSPLVKIVPQGQEVSPYSPFFTTMEQLDAASRSGKTMADYFGIPIKSEASVYDIYQITPKSSADVFVSTVAPASELNGVVIRSGGGVQYLVPNRSMWTPPTLVGSIKN